MEDVDQFGRFFMTLYRALQKNLRKEMSKRRTCNHIVCYYEGLTNEDGAQFPTIDVRYYQHSKMIRAI